MVTRHTSFSMKWEKNLLDVVCLQASYGFLNVCRYRVVIIRILWSPIAVCQRLEAKPGQRLQDFGVCSILDCSNQLFSVSDTKASMSTYLRDGGRPLTITAKI